LALKIQCYIVKNTLELQTAFSAILPTGKAILIIVLLIVIGRRMQQKYVLGSSCLQFVSCKLVCIVCDFQLKEKMNWIFIKMFRIFTPKLSFFILLKVCMI